MKHREENKSEKKIGIHFSDLWDNIKQSKTCIIEVPERGGGRANI